MSLKAAFCKLMFLVFLMPPQIGSSAEFPPGVPGVIFTAEEIGSMLKAMRNPDFDGPFWTPSVEQVFAFERDLGSFARTDSTFSRRIKTHLILYKRQYFGCIANGVQTLFVNFFCEQYWKYNDDWRRKVVVSRNFKGDCFFMIRYNPETRELFDLLTR